MNPDVIRLKCADGGGSPTSVCDSLEKKIIMVKAILGVCVLSLSLAILVFAGMAYFELQSAATSGKPPSAASMPLMKIVGPEFFGPPNAGTQPAKPTTVARTMFNRIYAIAGGGIFLAVLAVLVIAMPQSRRADHDAS